MFLFVDSYEEFQKLAVTAGSPLNHFNVPWDAKKIGWVQSINTHDSLKLAIEGRFYSKSRFLTKGKVVEKTCTFVIESCTNKFKSYLAFCSVIGGSRGGTGSSSFHTFYMLSAID